MSSLTDAGAEYREAVAAVAVHRHRQAAAELAHHAERTPETKAAAIKAADDVKWCRSLVVACGEVVKGEPFGQVVARQYAHRPTRGGRPDLGVR